MKPLPAFERPRQARRLEGKVALITGGDSGIGRAVAVAFAQEGADVVVAYFDEHDDARLTRKHVQAAGGRCELVAGDVSREAHCKKLIDKTIRAFGRLDVLVNNAAVQYPQDDFTAISSQQLEKTFRTNIFAYFYLTRYALEHLQAGSSIINTTSVTAYRGSPHLVDYASTKAAIVGFTRSLSGALADKKIRVNGVAPGPIWTPLIPASFDADHVRTFGSDTPMQRAGQPEEVAPAYVFLASDDASYITGQVIHPNGGEIVNA